MMKTKLSVVDKVYLQKFLIFLFLIFFFIVTAGVDGVCVVFLEEAKPFENFGGPFYFDRPYFFENFKGPYFFEGVGGPYFCDDYSCYEIPPLDPDPIYDKVIRVLAGERNTELEQRVKAIKEAYLRTKSLQRQEYSLQQMAINLEKIKIVSIVFVGLLGVGIVSVGGIFFLFHK